MRGGSEVAVAIVVVGRIVGVKLGGRYGLGRSGNGKEERKVLVEAGVWVYFIYAKSGSSLPPPSLLEFPGEESFAVIVGLYTRYTL